MSSRKLRLDMVRKRQAVPPKQALQAGLAASKHAWQLPAMRRARRIAAYFPVPGELDCEAGSGMLTLVITRS